jgi:hypothetical protein
MFRRSVGWFRRRDVLHVGALLLEAPYRYHDASIGGTIAVLTIAYAAPRVYVAASNNLHGLIVSLTCPSLPPSCSEIEPAAAAKQQKQQCQDHG